MKNTKKLDVFIDGLKVGVLAMTPDHRAAFQYSSGWLKNGFSLSPFSLPLDGKVYIPGNMNCSGLFGVFEDPLQRAFGCCFHGGVDLGYRHIFFKLGGQIDHRAIRRWNADREPVELSSKLGKNQRNSASSSGGCWNHRLRCSAGSTEVLMR